MKAAIHPAYNEIRVMCACGNSFSTRSTHKGDIHAFLATPVDERVGTSVADVMPTHPKSNLPANFNKQLLQRLGVARFQP